MLAGEGTTDAMPGEIIHSAVLLKGEPGNPDAQYLDVGGILSQEDLEDRYYEAKNPTIKLTRPGEVRSGAFSQDDIDEAKKVVVKQLVALGFRERTDAR
jgi:hypothetical protein